jgi:hypothetical protein
VKTLLRFAAALLILQAAGTAVAQETGSTTPSTSVADGARHSLAVELVDRPEKFSLQDVEYILIVSRANEALRLLQRFEDERADKQIGATSSAPGTTTLVSKGTVPKIIGVAVENGAVTQSQSGTTVTFRTNLAGAIRAAAGKGFFDLTPGDDPALNILGRFSFSASFDTSRGLTDATANTSTFTGDRQQLSQWTGRIQLVDHRDVQGKEAMAKWQQRVSPADIAGAVLAIAERQGDDATKDPALQRWVDDTAAAVSAAKAAADRTREQRIDDVEAELKRRDALFPTDAQLTPEMASLFAGYVRSATSFIQHRQDLLNEIAQGALVSLEYTNDRPVKAPATSNIRLVAAIGGSLDVTGNVSVTLFNTIPAGASRALRDIQAGAQLDFKMGSSTKAGAFTLSFAGKYLHQFENSFDDAGVMILNTTGTIAVGQAKLTIPIKGTGVSIPVSVTVANRTELIHETVVRGNIGLTYDLDSIFARFKP